MAPAGSPNVLMAPYTRFGLGDIATCVWIAKRLRARGASVSILAGHHAAVVARAHGETVVEDAEIDPPREAARAAAPLARELLESHLLLRPIDDAGARRWLNGFAHETDALRRRFERSRPDVVVAAFRWPALVAAASLGIPTVSLVNPYSHPSFRSPARAFHGVDVPARFLDEEPFLSFVNGIRSRVGLAPLPSMNAAYDADVVAVLGPRPLGGLPNEDHTLFVGALSSMPFKGVTSSSTPSSTSSSSPSCATTRPPSSASPVAAAPARNGAQADAVAPGRRGRPRAYVYFGPSGCGRTSADGVRDVVRALLLAAPAHPEIDFLLVDPDAPRWKAAVETPKNVEVVRECDDAPAVLAGCALAIHHGGQFTALHALAAGARSVVLPYNGDNHHRAADLAARGWAIALSRGAAAPRAIEPQAEDGSRWLFLGHERFERTPRELSEAITQALAIPSDRVREAQESLRAEHRDADGVAEVVLALAARAERSRVSAR